MSKDQDFVCEFIEIYRSKACLWKKTDPYYHNMKIREAAYTVLLDKYQEYYKKATKASVKSKINNLRTTYNKEYKKVKDSERSGAVYKPSLWYFDLMSFINDQLHPRTCANAICEDEDKQNAEGSQSKTDEHDDTCSGQSTQSDHERSSVSDKKELISNTKVFPPVAERLKNSDDLKVRAHDSFGKHVADELNSMPPEMVPYVKKMINLAIFEGHMRTLNVTSSIVTQQSSSVHHLSISQPQPDNYSSVMANEGLHQASTASSPDMKTDSSTTRK